MSGVFSDTQVRQLAQEILEREEYARFRPDPEEVARLFRFLQWLRDFLDWMDLQYEQAPWIFWSIITALALVAVLLLAHLIWSLRVALRAPVTKTVPRTSLHEQDLLEEARGLAARGQFLEAAHRIELAVIALLIQREVIELSRSDPNRILRKRITAAPLHDSLRRDFVQLLNRLERQRFRDHEEDPALYEAWCALHRNFEILAGRS